MNRGVLFRAALWAFLLILWGCGGGGSSSHRSQGTGSLSVTLDPTLGTAAGPSGTTHTLVIYRSDGTQVDKKVVNLSSQSMQVDFTGLPSGTLRLHAGVSVSKGSAELGSVDLLFDGYAPGAPIVLTMKQNVASVRIAQASTATNVGATSQLYPQALTDDNRYVYTIPTDWSWTPGNTAIATVSSTGLVTGVAQGSADVTATYGSSGLTASTTISVLTGSVQQGKWTVMVYLNAANSLYPDAYLNMNQLEAIAKGATDPNVRFIVQWKQVQGLEGNSSALFSGTRRYLVTPDPSNALSATNAIKSAVVKDLGSGVDMGDSATLKDFVQWTKANYPADHYALVMWSHGAGWYSTKAVSAPHVGNRAISYDDETGNYLSLEDIRSALADDPMDIIAFDACMMQGAEELVELHDRTNYIVGSEENTPEYGYPYNTSFKPFVDTPDLSTAELAKGISDGFIARYQSDSGVTWPLQQSVIDCSKASTFTTALDAFSQALLTDPNVGTIVPAMRRSSTRIEPLDGYYYYDLNQIASVAAASSSSSATTVSAANALTAALADCVVTNGTNSRGTYLKGMAIEFANHDHFVGTQTIQGYSTYYQKLQLSALTHWDELLSSATANP